MENIYPELFIPGDAVASGEVKTKKGIHYERDTRNELRSQLQSTVNISCAHTKSFKSLFLLTSYIHIYYIYTFYILIYIIFFSRLIGNSTFFFLVRFFFLLTPWKPFFIIPFVHRCGFFLWVRYISKISPIRQHVSWNTNIIDITLYDIHYLFTVLGIYRIIMSIFSC